MLKELSIHRGRGHVSTPPAPRRRQRSDQANALAFDARTAFFALRGEDITAIDGFGPYLSLKLIAECGDDLSHGRVPSILLLWLAGAEQQDLRQ